MTTQQARHVDYPASKGRYAESYYFGQMLVISGMIILKFSVLYIVAGMSMEALAHRLEHEQVLTHIPATYEDAPPGCSPHAEEDANYHAEW
jgi:hypothetical protein